MKAIISALVGIVTLTGCTAMATAPITMPVWLVIGVIFIFRPNFYNLWRYFTYTSFVQCVGIALFGLLFAWIGVNSPIIWFEQIQNWTFMVALPIAGAILIWLSLRVINTNPADKQRRVVCLLIQVGAALAAHSLLGYFQWNR